MLKKIAQYKREVVGLATLAAINAHAAVPAAVTTAIDDAKADAGTVAGLVLAVVFALLAFAYMRRQAK